MWVYMWAETANKTRNKNVHKHKIYNKLQFN